MRDYSMAVCTSHNTLGNLGFGLFNALCATDIHGLLASIKMIKVKSTRVIESAINTSRLRLVFAYPTSDDFRSGIGNSVYSLPVSRFFQPILSPLLSLLWCGLRSFWSGSALTNIRAIFSKSFGFKLRQAMGAVIKQRGRVIVGFHGSIVPHPCKPDIFEMTYERAE